MKSFYRVRVIDIDGGGVGKVYSEHFRETIGQATELERITIARSDERNPKYPFDTEVRMVDGVYGYCNGQFGIMVAVDRIFVYGKV